MTRHGLPLRHLRKPCFQSRIQVYHALKEAISCLSPIIRNRLRGLPAYVLDYSDLIAPNRCGAKCIAQVELTL